MTTVIRMTLALCVLLATLAGAQTTQPAGATAAVDPHAGHDHPPGQHPADDPHAGHGHAPGMHPSSEPAIPQTRLPEPTISEADFVAGLDLSALRTVTVQHRQTLKTLDSLARQTVTQIAGTARVNGHDHLYTFLDMAFRPEAWRDRNIIRIKNVPVRKDLAASLTSLPQAERDRILQEGTISLSVWQTAETRAAVQKIASQAAFKLDALRRVEFAAVSLQQLGNGDLQSLPMIPPPPGSDEQVWMQMVQLYGHVPQMVEHAKAIGIAVPSAPAGYDPQRVSAAVSEAFALQRAWHLRHAGEVNTHAAGLAAALPLVVPEAYPSAAKRNVEVVYNRLTKLTMPGAALYFAAFVAFLIAARSQVAWIRRTGLVLMVVGFLVHTAGIGIRWWLVEKSTGDWFHSIPIKNQFESVLFSAWFGAAVGIALEAWWKKSFFGAAASFVGWLSLVAIFVSPFVFGRDIGGEIGQVNGVLMSYWLYIHVTTVVASYALIGMSFCLGVWWLIRYWKDYGTLSRLPNARQISADAAPGFDVLPKPQLAGASERALAMEAAPIRNAGALTREERALEDRTATDAKGFLATLDQCNLVVLQLAFWILGLGIIFGAIWADQSWGRPWGWDPKETFALVTFIVYLIVVHIRIATPHKAWWTAVLSVVGFFVMLFNWIGVNFFLVGLHSYA
jgi:cytochrome c-type biogenesis protein CcsB